MRLSDAAQIWTGGTPDYLHRFDRQADGSYAEAEPTAIGPLGPFSGCRTAACSSAVFGGLLQRRHADGRVVTFAGHFGYVLGIDWTRLDGEIFVASIDRQGSAWLWRGDGTPVREVVHPRPRPASGVGSPGMGSVRFSPDGTRLMTTSEGGTTSIWPVRTSDLLALAQRRLRPLTPEKEPLRAEQRGW